MFFSYLLSSIKSRLSVKSILIVVIFISTVSLLFTVFFMTYQKRLLIGELYKRADALGRNLAFNSSDHILNKDQPIMQSLVSTVQEEPDIEKVFLTDLDGAVISTTDISFKHENETTYFNLMYDSPVNTTWYPFDGNTKMRLMRSIVIIAPVIESDTLLYSPDITVHFDYNALPPTNDYQPIFSHTGEELIFTSAILYGTRPIAEYFLARVSLEKRTLRYLVMGSNCFYSHDGRYLVFNERLPRQLVVLDTVTRKREIIASYTPDRYGVPCFTPDDRYVIVTLLSENGYERLFRIPREGGEHEQLTFHDGRHWYPNCSPDGKWILYSDIGDSTLHVYDNEKKTSSQVFPDLKELHFSGSFSPDGTKISYLRGPDGSSMDVFVADFPGNGIPEKRADPYGAQLTFTGGSKWFTDWSPDGKWITYAHRFGFVRRRSKVFIISPDGGDPINISDALQTRRVTIGYAVLEISMQNLNRAIARGNRIAVILAFTFTGIAILVASFLIGNIVRPVKTIAHSAKKIAEGDFDQKILLKRSDEIGILAHSFNTMTDQLKTLIEEKDIRNRELEEAIKELQTLDKSKDDFLSLVSHELRTPLSSILVYADILLDDISLSEEKRKKYHAIILSETKRLTRLINDVLDLTKIQAGRMVFSIEVLNVRDLVVELFDTFQPVFEKHNIHFEFDQIQDDIFLEGDRDKVLLVLTNIFSNAVKNTPSGGTISVAVTIRNDTGTIAVKDTGRGIAPEQIPKVFDRFSQLENIDLHAEGSGLGMSISKLIIEKLGGRIWIESEINYGTTVFFTLPFAISGSNPEKTSDALITSQSVAKSEPSNKQIPSTILIVDDERPLLEALQECIEKAGYLTLVATGGHEAMHLAVLHLPEVMILDVMMPDISGLDVCRKLRSDKRTAGIKIIMLSARSQEKEKEEGLKAGADRYITKPFDYKELVKAIGELLD